MAAKRGSDAKVRKGGTNLAGVQVKSITMTSEGIDISSDDDTKFRTFLAGGAGQETLEISVEGVLKDSVLQDIAFNPSADKLLTDITFLFLDGATIAGNFYMGTLNLNHETRVAGAFSTTFQSSGAWTYTAAGAP